ncbi:hypothetical protein AAFF_G00317190 [Aldrovandia affinis]|uniref:Uncharacterized protein n=1 Tax=Aldrovandia affinis TaxID=143900 RepID=A0AAD7R7S4_9TELE|nr:hypothetical protein AAFF_G00317190 [Aldrovandia affinis]
MSINAAKTRAMEAALEEARRQVDKEKSLRLIAEAKDDKLEQTMNTVMKVMLQNTEMQASAMALLDGRALAIDASSGGCGALDTVSHVFWDCPFVGEFWTLVQGLLQRVGPGHVLSRDGVVYLRALGFLPSVTSGVLWDLLYYAKLALREARMAVVSRRMRVMGGG